MGWDETFADRYEEWSAPMTADVAFYVGRLDGSHQDKPVPHSVRFWVGDNRIDLTLDGGGTSSLWWATKNEWLGLLDVAGLEVAALYGGFAGEPFTGESGEYVFVARHRDKG